MGPASQHDTCATGSFRLIGQSFERVASGRGSSHVFVRSQAAISAHPAIRGSSRCRTDAQRERRGAGDCYTATGGPPPRRISKYHAQLFDELCIQFPGRFHPKHVDRLAKRVKQWRQDARARGVVVGRLQYSPSATSLAALVRRAAPFIGLRWFSGWKKILIRLLQNFSPNSKLVIRDSIAAASCVLCAVACRSGAERLFSD